eukprot:2996309-Rhodomonas_salina.1
MSSFAHDLPTSSLVRRRPHTIHTVDKIPANVILTDISELHLMAAHLNLNTEYPWLAHLAMTPGEYLGGAVLQYQGRDPTTDQLPDWYEPITLAQPIINAPVAHNIDTSIFHGHSMLGGDSDEDTSWLMRDDIPETCTRPSPQASTTWPPAQASPPPSKPPTSTDSPAQTPHCHSDPR